MIRNNMKNSELCSRVHYFLNLSQSRRLPLLQVVSNNKSFSVGVQSPTEINVPAGAHIVWETMVLRRPERSVDVQ